MTLSQVVAILQKECRKAGSQRAWAAAHGVAPAYVSDIIQGRREPGSAVLEALGIERVVSYRKVK